MKFWLQTQAPAGNWIDNLGSTRALCISHGKYLLMMGESVRVIERTDCVIWAPDVSTPEE